MHTNPAAFSAGLGRPGQSARSLAGLAGLLPLYVGLGKTRQILLKPARISANEALEMGIVDEVVPRHMIEQAAQRRARDLADLDPCVVRSVKRLLRRQLPNLQQHFEAECQEMKRAFQYTREEGPGRDLGAGNNEAFDPDEERSKSSPSDRGPVADVTWDDGRMVRSEL